MPGFSRLVRCRIAFALHFLSNAASPQECEPLEAFRLHPGTAPTEDSLSEAEARNKRHSKAVTLKLPRSESDSDCEETQGLLQCQSDTEQDKSLRLQRVWFAAESEKQHLSWHSESSHFALSPFHERR